MTYEELLEYRLYTITFSDFIGNFAESPVENEENRKSPRSYYASGAFSAFFLMLPYTSFQSTNPFPLSSICGVYQNSCNYTFYHNLE